jgi:hypothetical protein
MAKGGARPGAGRPKKPATPKAQAPRGGARRGAGRPVSKKFAPTADQRGNVEAMTGFGISQEEICRVTINPETGRPIDKKTLELHFADEIETGQIKANATVGRFIYATITGGPGGSNYEPGRIELAKFWAARRMGWKETTVHKHEGQIDNGSSALESVMRDVARLAPDPPVAGDTRGEDPSGNSAAET